MSFGPRLTPDLGNYQSLEYWVDSLIARRLGQLGFVNQFGTLANRPAATASNVLPGSLYVSTDVGQVDQAQNGQWITVVPGFLKTIPAKAYLNANQPLPAATYTKILLDTVVYDPGRYFDVATNHRYVCPQTGTYQVMGLASMNVASGENIVRVYRNGAAATSGNDLPASTGYGLMVDDIVVNAQQGDSLELWAYSAGGGTLGGVVTSWPSYMSVIQIH